MLSNKVSSSNTNVQQSITSKSTASAVSNTNASVNSTTGLEKGQIIKGEIIDVQYNEVGVKLDDGRVLIGKLEDSLNLSIGDKVAFRVEEVSLKNLVLKIVSESQSLNIQNTIDKALEAAGLGKTKLNQNIIKELFNQQMPVDKKTIALLIQQSITNKDSSVSTLVLMNRLHIPVTKENIAMFESFLNKNNNIMNDISRLADQIPELFNNDSSKTFDANVAQSKELLQLILKGINIGQNNGTMDVSNIINNIGLADGRTGNLTESNILTGSINLAENSILNPSANVITDNFSQKTMNQIVLNQNQLNIQENQLDIHENLQQLPSGKLLSKEEGAALAAYIRENPVLSSLFSDELIVRLENGTADVKEAGTLLNLYRETSEHNSGLMSQLFEKAPGAKTLLSAFEDLHNTGLNNGSSPGQSANINISSFLSPKERGNLVNLLDGLPVSNDLKDKIQSGNISPKDLLNWIENNLGNAKEDSFRNLVSSKEFKSLVKESMIGNWTLTPQSLKEGEIDKHFQNLSNQLNELKEYIEQNPKHINGSALGQAENLQENVSFMKTLNEIFTYVPLPLKMQNQNAHGELYVYSKKKAGRTASDGIRVLLHLDMDNLGPVDIHINLQGSNVVTKFYLDDSDTVNLIQSCMPQLEQALEKKGYSLNSEVLKKENEVNIEEEFMNQNSAAPSITRYNFDVRA